MSVYPLIAVAIGVSLAIAAAAFFRPDHVFLRSAIAAMCALALPYATAYAIGPFLGEGAGMGVAFILYALSAVILLAAVAAFIGAAARYVWMAMRG